MATLLTLYSVCFGVGLLYVLVAGILGLHGSGGHDAGGGGGAGHDAGGHPGLAAGHSAHAGHSQNAANDESEGQGGQLGAAGQHGSQAAAVSYNPFNVLSVMCFLASFGGSGLIASALNINTFLSFPLALVGGLFMAWLLYLLLTRVLFQMQSGRAPSEDDMLGLEAEVLTPIEAGHFGEIAYVLQGSRFTSPAKLMRGEHAGRADTVRIVKVEHGTVYVEVRHQLLP